MTDEELYDRCRHPSLGRRVVGTVLLHIPDVAIGISVGGILGLLFAASGMSVPVAMLLAGISSVIVARLADNAWRRAVGLKPMSTATQRPVETDTGDDEVVDDEVAAPATDTPTRADIGLAH